MLLRQKSYFPLFCILNVGQSLTGSEIVTLTGSKEMKAGNRQRIGSVIDSRLYCLNRNTNMVQIR